MNVMSLVSALLLILAGSMAIRLAARFYLLILAGIGGKLLLDSLQGSFFLYQHETTITISIFVAFGLIAIIAGFFRSMRRGSEVVLVCLLTFVLSEPIATNLDIPVRVVAIILLTSSIVWPTMLIALSASALLVNAFTLDGYWLPIVTATTIGVVWFLDGGLDRLMNKTSSLKMRMA